MARPVELRITGDGKGGVRATKEVQGGLKDLQGSIKSFVKDLALMAGAYVGVRETVQLFVGEVKKGLGAVNDYKKDIAALSAITLTFMEKARGASLADMYREAKEYAEGLYPVIEDISAVTLMNGRQANLMVQEFAKAGQVIDTTNKAQVEGLKNIANALYVITGGRDLDRQIITEIGHLMRGQVTAQDILGKMLVARHPELAEQLKLWVSQGAAVERLGVLLKGFGPASAELADTWDALKGTLETTEKQILREGMKPVYEDLIGLAKDLNVYLKDHEEELQTGILKGYLTLKTSVQWLISGWATIAAKVYEAAQAIGELGAANPLNKKAWREDWKKYADNMREEAIAAYEVAISMKQAAEKTVAEIALLGVNKAVTGKEKKKAKAPKMDLGGPENGGDILNPRTGYTVQQFWDDSFEHIRSKGVSVAEELSETWKHLQMEMGGLFSPFAEGGLLKGGAFDEVAKDVKSVAKTVGEEGESMSERLRNAVTGWASDFSARLNEAVWSAKLSFSEIAESFGRMITQVIIQTQVVEPFLAAMGLGFAKGGVISGGRALAFAQGGVVYRPTIFPMAHGLGLMGEAGPEAILPLKRTRGGDLGVQASPGAVNVTVINNAPRSHARVEEQSDGRGGKDIRVVVDEIVAGNIAMGGKTRKTLEALGLPGVRVTGR
ncbi:MAG: hypothetical protein Kow0025_21010 [Thermodesulfovibrionales bacterium]